MKREFDTRKKGTSAYPLQGEASGNVTVDSKKKKLKSEHEPND